MTEKEIVAAYATEFSKQRASRPACDVPCNVYAIRQGCCACAREAYEAVKDAEGASHAC